MFLPQTDLKSLIDHSFECSNNFHRLQVALNAMQSAVPILCRIFIRKWAHKTEKCFFCSKGGTIFL